MLGAACGHNENRCKPTAKPETLAAKFLARERQLAKVLQGTNLRRIDAVLGEKCCVGRHLGPRALEEREQVLRRLRSRVFLELPRKIGMNEEAVGRQSLRRAISMHR